MRNVRNNKAIRRLSKQSFRANRTRNLVASIAIALTAILFTAVFTVGLGLIENAQRSAMQQAGGDMHGSIKDISEKQYQIFKRHRLIQECGRGILVADAVENPEFLKRHVEMHFIDKNLYPHWFLNIVEGTAPSKADEILIDEKSMELLGMQPKAGCEITLQVKIGQNSKSIERTFRVSGVIQASAAMNVGFVFVSDAYLDAYQEELKQCAEDITSNAGKITMDVMFQHAGDIQRKLNQVITYSGFSVDESSENYIASNANWAYFTSGATGDPLVMAGMAAAVVLIMLTGYLIIYNIFQISIIRDIRYYGLLKTIGTTGRQMKRILRRQAVWLCALGMPAGLLLGFFVGMYLLPVVSTASNLGSEQQTFFSPQPWIFIGAAVFTLMTVLLSEWKPGRIAARVSPLEALRFTDQGKLPKKQKRSTDGGKLFRMAFSNLGRNKARTAIVVCSLSLTVVLMNSVYTVTSSIEKEGFLSKMILCEDIIGNAALWNHHYYPNDENDALEMSLSESFINACENQAGFQAGGRIYMVKEGPRIPVETWKIPDYILRDETGAPGEYTPVGFSSFAGYEVGGYCTNFYGMERFVLDKMTVEEGETDKEIIWEKLMTGRYILYSVDVDDDQRVIENKVKYHAGDRVTLDYGDGKVKEYEILSVAQSHTFSLTNRISSVFSFYVSEAEFKEHYSDAYLMSFLLDVEEGQEDAMEEFLHTYTTEVEPTMSYESRKTFEGDFNMILGMITMVGLSLSGMVGLIGMLNFINVMLTSVAIRKREFAMMEAIGMTKRQIVGMLMGEGAYYALLTMVCSLGISAVFSLTALRSIGQGIWFIRYRFTLLPVAIACPILLAFGVLTPKLIYAFRKKESVVEAIRE